MAKINTLVDVVLYWNEVCPNRAIYTFLRGKQTDRRTFAEILASARAIAGVIRKYAVPGDRVLINKYPGIDYVEAVFGCLFAGVIAVPVYPPRFGQKLERLMGIIKNCSPALALAEESLVPKEDQYVGNFPWITDTCQHEAPPCQSPASPDDVVLLQYTSGSTSSPKGVKITQRNLLANLETIAQLMEVDSRDTNVSWLPPYHDMGLIGSILETFYSGMHSVLMSPFAFVQKPIRWLSAISKYKATVTGGPNFAFDLLNERIRPEQMEGIDLQSLNLIYCGAEPIRRHVLDRFIEKFSPYGVKKEALVSCYGLAEATLIVASSPKSSALSFLEARTRYLEEKVKPETTPQNSTGIKHLVSCGKTSPLHEIKIVDPHTRLEKPRGEVGEIWFRGPSVASGYWNLKEESKEIFDAKIQGDETAYMRTGDFGLIHEENLYITGRIKDMVILKGRNLYPQDIEQTVEDSHDSLRSSGCAAFSIEDHDEEKLVIVQEVDRNKSRNKNDLDFEDIFTSISKKVFESHGVSPHTISLVRTNTIPVTSSGKIQRYLSKKYFLESKLDELKRMEAR